MKASAFGHLHNAIGDSDSLERVYGEILKNLFERPLWESGTIEFRRVLWSHGRQARIEDLPAFRSPGLYFWGIEDRPLYIGKTRKSFGKRFSRYIWHQRSQCNLAKNFEAALVSGELNGFPVEIRNWYARSYRGSTVRLRGAVRFAQEGIAKVWFALFPHDGLAEVDELERELIPVAEEWNAHRGLRPLLNLEFSCRENKPNSG